MQRSPHVRTSLQALLLGALAIPAFGSSAAFGPLEDIEYIFATDTIEWPTEMPILGGGPDAAEIVSGDFTGDQVVDLIVLTKSGIPVLVFGPELYSALSEVDSSLNTVVSIASWPASAGRETDLLLVTDGAGLSSVAYDEVANDFSPAFVQNMNWINVESLLVDDYLGTMTLFGVLPDQRTVVSTFEGALNFTDGPSWTVTEDIIDFAVVDFDGNGVRDITILTSANLYAFLDSGVVTTSRAGGNSTGALVRVGSGPGEKLAWVLPLPTGRYILRMIDSTGNESPVHLTFPFDVVGGTNANMGLVGLAAGDIDGDGDDDLLFPDGSYERGVVLLNQGGSSHFSTGDQGQDYVLLALSDLPDTAATGNDCIPVVCDLDQDGMADIAYPLTNQASVLLFRNIQNIQPLMADELDTAYTNYSLYDSWDNLYPDRGILNLALELPSPIGDINAIQVVVFEQQGEDEASLEDNAVSNTIYETGGVSPGLPWTPITIPHVGFPDTDFWNDRWHYYIFYRLVNYDNSTGGFHVRSPFRRLGMTIRHEMSYEDDPGDYEYLTDFSGGVGFVIYEGAVPESDEPGGGGIGDPGGPQQGNISLGAVFIDARPPYSGTGVIPGIPGLSVQAAQAWNRN